MKNNFTNKTELAKFHNVPVSFISDIERIGNEVDVEISDLNLALIASSMVSAPLEQVRQFLEAIKGLKSFPSLPDASEVERFEKGLKKTAD